MSETSSRRSWARYFRFQEAGLVGVILLLGLVLTLFGGRVEVEETRSRGDGQVETIQVQRSKFLNSETLVQIAKNTSFIAIMAIGATFIIVSGGIDLSVGAVYALAAAGGAIVLHHFGPGGSSPETSACFGVGAGIGATLAIAVLCGLANGLMVVTLKVHPFIITLGTMAIFRGIAFVITDGQSISQFPRLLRQMVRFELNRLTIVPLAVMTLMMGLSALYLSRSAAGRRIYALGGNEMASRYSGIRVGRVKLGVYIISGFTAGMAALLSLGYYGSASSSTGQGYELNVIAAAVVGGASLSGGRGSAVGAVLGALILEMISTGIIILGINQNYSQIITGCVVIAAVVLDQVNNWIAQRRLLKS